MKDFLPSGRRGQGLATWGGYYRKCKTQNLKYIRGKRGLAVRARRSTDNNPNPTLLIHYPILACETPTGSIIFYPRSERANAGLCAAGLTVSVDLLLYWVGGNSCGRLFQRGTSY